MMAIAINAQNGGGTTDNMVDTKVLNNSSVATIYANGIRVAGGRNSLIQNNYVSDNADLAGIVLGTFGTAGNPCESVTVKNNLLVRCGGFRSIAQGVIYINDGTTGIVEQNTVVDCWAPRAIAIRKFNVTLTSNIVNNPAGTGFYIYPGATGSATINYNTVAYLHAGQQAFRNDGTATFTTPSLTGNSWQETITEVRLFQNTNYGGTVSQLLPVGNYTTAQLAAKGVLNDWASALRVPSGRQVIAYAGDNFTGTSWTFNYDTPVFPALNPNANDQLSSLKVLTGPAHRTAGPGDPVADNSNAAAGEITIYPNPATTGLTIRGLTEPTDMVIRSSSTGVIVHTQRSMRQVDIHKLPAGAYLITIGKNKPIPFIKN